MEFFLILSTEDEKTNIIPYIENRMFSDFVYGRSKS